MKNFNYNEEVMQKKLYYCKSKELMPIIYMFDVRNINENLSKSKCKIYFQTALDNLDILIFFE